MAREWTVMVYLAGDNNLNVDFLWNLKERTGKHMFNTILPSTEARVQFKLGGATRQESRSLR